MKAHCLSVGPGRPLEGVRVIDLTQAWAGPYATMFMADWGAEVIMAEVVRAEAVQFYHPLTRGVALGPEKLAEDQRLWSRAYPDWVPGPRPWNRQPAFNGYCRNKLSATLDVRRPEGLELFKGMVRVSDIVLENNAPDVMEKLGLGYEDLKRIRPDLVMVRMPAFGLEGPYRSFRAWGAHVEGVIGHTWVRGYRDIDHSLKDDVYSSDAVAGITAAFTAMAALRRRDLTGQGQLIELALSEVLPPLLAEAILDCTMNGREQSSLGNMHFSEAPHGCYRCQGEDHWVAIAVSSDEEWEGLRRAMGHPPWAQDVRFGNVLGRWRNQEEVDRHIGEWTRGMAARDVMCRLQKEGVPATMVLDEAEVYGDPQLSALGFFEEITHPETGTHRYPGFMGRLGRLSDAVHRPAPCLGQHNPYVYRELLGLSEAEYEGLRASGHIIAERSRANTE